MNTRQRRAGQAVLTLAHVAGMIDMVALPLWIGALMQHYGDSPVQAGMTVTLFLAAAVASSAFFAPRFNRLPRRALACGGFALAAAAFGVASRQPVASASFGALAVLHALVWVVTEVEKPLLLASAHRALFAPGQRDEEQASMALAKLERPFRVLDAHLARRDWLIGTGAADRFTVADLNVATVMDLAPQCGIALDAWPRLQAWHQRCLARPAAADWRDVKFSIPRPPTALGLLRMFV